MKKQLRLETHPDFEDWLFRVKQYVSHPKSDLMESWKNETGHDEKMKYSKSTLTKWMMKYEKILEFKLISDRKNDTYYLKSE